VTNISNIYQPTQHQHGWGIEYWIANSEKYCGKILGVNEDKSCSMHFHIKKHETFHILSGTIMMELINKEGDEENFLMNKGDTLEVPPGLMHRFYAVDGPAEILEVSTQHFEEDSYRVYRGD
jgi:mannose-6-phosphate isomerase-like protein (cupin superfamily)